MLVMGPTGNNSNAELPPIINNEQGFEGDKPSNLPEVDPLAKNESLPISELNKQAKQSAPVFNIPQLNTPLKDSDDSSVKANDSIGSTTNFASNIRDKDLIDKEWVDKAKQIVEKNRYDPYKQSEELTILKADYIKTRFNKSIKLTN
ncbi:MAG TPA: hypothetical protein VLF63_00935 [Patescibacteria group bacterium]|nr:hypothetical protein [Patescibacteria group bacterium]